MKIGIQMSGGEMGYVSYERGEHRLQVERGGGGEVVYYEGVSREEYMELAMSGRRERYFSERIEGRVRSRGGER